MNCFFVYYSLVDLMDTSPVAFQSSVFWWPVSEVEVLKVGALDVRFKTFTFQGEDGSCKFPPCCMSPCRRWGLPQDYLVSASPTYFDVGFFLIPTCRSCSASFWISFRENYSIWSCRLIISMGEGKFKSLLCHHLELESWKQFIDLLKWFI